ncbi:MAG: 4-diphosphocytidyl-2-C-methyl-D-erythritol kinase [Solirubrobacteraceae bacterium]|nr:4-diphosphocytidyl-2-C-methyl-D-erythritol kinase [Solirubrobacteraceae bacterium]
MSVHRALAPAKVNLGLFMGPVRARDGRHELVTVMQSISLADELTLEPAPDGAIGDELLCPSVPGAPGENLAAAALRAFRESTGWDAPPLRLRIVKRIPVAAGLGGGSADAAAVLRLAAHASGLRDEQLLRTLGAGLGADVSAQIAPGRWLASGAGERLEALPSPRSPFGLLVLALPAALSTAAVYAEADRMGVARSMQELSERRRELAAALEHGASLPAATELLHNDLQRAAVSLCPQIAPVLKQVRAAGAEIALVSGSGPTVIGLFARGAGGAGGAEHPAEKLRERAPAPIWATPVEESFARAATVDE